ncbi:MAG: hypothetical protein MHM6MM_009198, partial [Cercozoa sp. M6MM]
MSVWLTVRHAQIDSIRAEKKFALSSTLLEVKERLRGITGASPDNMRVRLCDSTGRAICGMSGDGSTLRDFGVRDRQELLVFDTHFDDNKDTAAAIEDYALSKVEKYEISEEDYDRRSDTFRRWKQRNFGKSDEEIAALRE